jgi:hypothetical protein
MTVAGRERPLGDHLLIHNAAILTGFGTTRGVLGDRELDQRLLGGAGHWVRERAVCFWQA